MRLFDWIEDVADQLMQLIDQADTWYGRALGWGAWAGWVLVIALSLAMVTIATLYIIIMLLPWVLMLVIGWMVVSLVVQLVRMYRDSRKET